MNFFKKILKAIKGKAKNWQVLAAIGIDYLTSNLSGRIRFSNPFFATLWDRVMDMGSDSVMILTDDEPNDAKQMKQLLKQNLVPLISITTAGAVTEIDNDTDRMAVIAILEETCEKLKAQMA